MRYNQAMATSLLIAHVVLLSLSLLATMSSVFVSVLGRIVPNAVVLLNTIGTTIGLLCGVALLFKAPLDAKCIMLAAYLLAFAGTQAYITSRNQRLAVSSDS